MKFFFLLILFVACLHLHAQQTSCTDSLIADFRFFVEKFEQTHPEPYGRYGGKTLFLNAVEACEQQMRRDTICTSGQLASRINAFLVPLHDGHTSIANPDAEPAKNKEMLCAAVKFRALEDGLFVRAIDRRYECLIGSRLLEVEGVAADEIFRRVAARAASENQAGTLLNACWQLRNKESLAHCLDKAVADSLHMILLDAHGVQHAVALPFITQDALRALHYEGADSSLALPTKNLAYAFLDETSETMYFRASAMYARENLEYEYEKGMSSFADDLNYCYFLNQTELPDDTEDAIAQLPSFSGTFYEMLLEMKKRGSRNLIIDLRGNSGGWTPIALPTLYQLWGEDYLNRNMGTSRRILISPLYIEKLNTTLADFNAANAASYQFGDFVNIGSSDAAMSGRSDEEIIMSDGMMSCVKDRLLEQKGRAVYTPAHIFVVTDAQTFSAAFHYAFYLWKMGAKIVGTSSSQAPNTFMEQTPLRLPRTNLFASISNSIQMFLPADHPKAEALTPDFPLTADLFQRYGGDPNADILYIMDELVKK